MLLVLQEPKPHLLPGLAHVATQLTGATTLCPITIVAVRLCARVVIAITPREIDGFTLTAIVPQSCGVLAPRTLAIIALFPFCVEPLTSNNE